MTDIKIWIRTKKNYLVEKLNKITVLVVMIMKINLKKFMMVQYESKDDIYSPEAINHLFFSQTNGLTDQLTLKTLAGIRRYSVTCTLYYLIINADNNYKL